MINKMIKVCCIRKVLAASIKDKVVYILVTCILPLYSYILFILLSDMKTLLMGTYGKGVIFKSCSSDHALFNVYSGYKFLV